MTSRHLSAIGRKYMRRMGLVEWIPATTFGVVRNLTNENGDELHGRSSWMVEERTCFIGIRPNPDEDFMKETLIHELLHVVLEGHLEVQSEYDANYEFALNRLAKTIHEAWAE